MNPTKTERDRWRERLSSPYACFDNTREGKQLAARLASKDVRFDINGFMAEKIGLGKEYTEGNIHYMPKVSIRSLKICFSVPIPFDEELPQVPKWLREVTFSEIKKFCEY